MAVRRGTQLIGDPRVAGLGAGEEPWLGGGGWSRARLSAGRDIADRPVELPERVLCRLGGSGQHRLTRLRRRSCSGCVPSVALGVGYSSTHGHDPGLRLRPTAMSRLVRRRSGGSPSVTSFLPWSCDDCGEASLPLSLPRPQALRLPQAPPLPLPRPQDLRLPRAPPLPLRPRAPRLRRPRAPVLPLRPRALRLPPALCQRAARTAPRGSSCHLRRAAPSPRSATPRSTPPLPRG